MSENLEPTMRDIPPSEADIPLEPSVDETDTAQLRAEIEETRADMSQTVDEIQGRVSPQGLRTQTTDTVKRTAVQAKDTAAQKLQQVAGQVSEKARPMVSQVSERARPVVDQTKQLGTRARSQYQQLQERTGIEITPRMLGIVVCLLAGAIAVIALLRRLRGSGAAEEDEVIVAELPLDSLPAGKHTLTKVD